MKRWFRVILITLFTLAAVSLVVIQLIQTRRTFSISDSMFNVSVSSAMDEVISQLNSEVFQTGTHPAAAFNYQELDSLIVEELLLAGIDLHPVLDATHAEVLLADDGTFYNDGGDPLSLRQMASRSGSRKIRLHNGQIVVWADGKCYDLSGRRLKLE